MFALLLSLTVLHPTHASLPDLWFVTTRDQEYVVGRQINGKTTYVYREPVDVADTSGPHGVISELWPSPDQNAFVFLRFAFNNSIRSPDFESKLISYDIVTKRKQTRFSGTELAEVSLFHLAPVVTWPSRAHFQTYISYEGKIHEVTVPLDPRQATGEKSRVTHFRSWEDLTSFLKEKSTWTHYAGAVAGSTVKLLPNLQVDVLSHGEDIQVNVNGITLITTSDTSAIREMRAYGDQWLVLTTYTLVHSGSPSLPSNTSYENYNFRSHLIDLTKMRVVFGNDAYLLRLANVGAGAASFCSSAVPKP